MKNVRAFVFLVYINVISFLTEKELSQCSH